MIADVSDHMMAAVVLEDDETEATPAARVKEVTLRDPLLDPTLRSFSCRITLGGLIEWVRDRRGLAAREPEHRPPDRPPDIDSPSYRWWVQWPGEERLPYFETHGAPDQTIDEHMIVTVRWAVGGLGVVALTMKGEGEQITLMVEPIVFDMGLRLAHPTEAVEVVFRPRARAATIDKVFQATLKRFTETLDAIGAEAGVPVECEMMTYADWEEIGREVEEARVAAGSFGRVPGAGVIQ